MKFLFTPWPSFSAQTPELLCAFLKTLKPHFARVRLNNTWEIFMSLIVFILWGGHGVDWLRKKGFFGSSGILFWPFHSLITSIIFSDLVCQEEPFRLLSLEYNRRKTLRCAFPLPNSWKTKAAFCTVFNTSSSTFPWLKRTVISLKLWQKWNRWVIVLTLF